MNIKELESRAEKILTEIKELIDDSIKIKKISPENKKAVSKLWNNFIGGFISYVKLRSKETKENLLSMISFTKFF